MYGADIYDDSTKGIIPRLIGDIFDYVENADENITFQFKMSILQIYKENIYDLLTGENNLKIKENPIRGIYVDKLTEVYVDSFETFMEYVDLSQENRIVSETKLNSYSSRSHSILIFEVTQNINNANFSKKGTLNLVDLAGSEKISKTGAVGETLEEAKKINLSLSALGNVIHALTSNAEHIPYRDSKLTRILQESLGGNYKTSLIVTCSPHSYHFEETTSSLKFAQRVKHIKNKVKINIKLTYEELQKIINELRKQLGWAKDENQKLREIMAENGIECTIVSKFDDDKYKSNEKDKDSDSDSEHNEKKISKTRKYDKNILSKINNNDNKNNSNSDNEKKEDLLSKTHKQIIVNPLNNDEDEKDLNSNCNEHSKIIKELKKQIDDLNLEIKEKDSIISTLEESNKMKQKEIDKNKETNSIFNVNSNDIPKMLRDIQDMYDEINENIIKILGHYDQLKNNKDIEEFIENFSKLVSDINANNDKYKNEDIECFKGLSSIILNILNNCNNESIDDNIRNLNNKYQKNINLLFDNVITDKSNPNNKLINYSTLFIYLYCESFTNSYFSSKINEKILSHNNLLIQANTLLLKITEDLLKSNLDISNKLNNADMDKITNNLMKIKNDSYKLSFTETQSPQNFRQHNRKRTKIMSLINRKGLDMLRKQRKDYQNDNSLQLDILNPQFNQINQINQVKKVKKTENPIFEKEEENEENNDIKKNFSSFNEDKSLNQKIVIPISETDIFQNKQEKKKSKLTMLKEYIVKAFKETEDYKKEMLILKNSFIMILNKQLETIIKKLADNNIVKKEELKSIEKIIKEQNIDKVINEYKKKEKNKNKLEKKNDSEKKDLKFSSDEMFDKDNEEEEEEEENEKEKEKEDEKEKEKEKEDENEKEKEKEDEKEKIELKENNNNLKEIYKIKNKNGIIENSTDKKNNTVKNPNQINFQISNPKKDLKKEIFNNEVGALAKEYELEDKRPKHKRNSKTIFGDLKTKTEKEIKLYPNEVNLMLTSESNIEENKNKVKNKNGFFSERKERVFSDNLSKYTYDNINKKKTPLSPISKNFNTYFNYENGPNSQNVSSIEDIVDDYLNTGTATRRFDGIGFTIKNHKVKCLFRGGLSANNSLDITPIGTHMKSLVGDDFCPNPDDIL